MAGNEDKQPVYVTKAREEQLQESSEQQLQTTKPATACEPEWHEEIIPNLSWKQLKVPGRM